MGNIHKLINSVTKAQSISYSNPQDLPPARSNLFKQTSKKDIRTAGFRIDELLRNHNYSTPKHEQVTFYI